MKESKSTKSLKNNNVMFDSKNQEMIDGLK